MGLRPEKVTFTKAVAKLDKKDQSLSEKLENLITNDAYIEARKIRNEVTHNYLPNVPGMGVFKPKNHLLGVVHNLWN